MKTYTFVLEINATADSPEDAWNEAVAAFGMDPGVCPDDYMTEAFEDDSNVCLPEGVASSRT